MILPIVPDDHPILSEQMEEFDFANPPCDPVELANNLIETMVHHKAIGLSANQCGLPYRVFVLHSQEPLACFNPRIVDTTTELILLDEGCVSFPMLFLKVKRPTIIRARYFDAHGEVHTDKFIGMTSRCFQHELDHLNGIKFTERASSIHLERGLRQRKNVSRKLKRGEIQIRGMVNG